VKNRSGSNVIGVQKWRQRFKIGIRIIKNQKITERIRKNRTRLTDRMSFCRRPKYIQTLIGELVCTVSVTLGWDTYNPDQSRITSFHFILHFFCQLCYFFTSGLHLWLLASRSSRGINFEDVLQILHTSYFHLRASIILHTAELYLLHELECQGSEVEHLTHLIKIYI